jgi:hypothetical protein
MAPKNAGSRVAGRLLRSSPMRSSALRPLVTLLAAIGAAYGCSSQPPDAPQSGSELAPGAPSANPMTIVRATYGGNEGAIDGNVTARVAAACNGKTTCEYAVDVTKLFPPAPPCPGFADVLASDSMCVYLAKARDKGVMPAPTGCAAGSFCPTAPVTRAEMATYVVRATFPTLGPSTSPQYFTDVPPTSPYYPFVQIMKDRGITAGCSATTYCGADPVTRGQMAVFLMRAKYAEASGGATRFVAPTKPIFDDVPSNHPFFRFVQQLAALGITSGCDGRNFCPDRAITKAEAATFVTRAIYPSEVPLAVPLTGRAKDFALEYRCADGNVYKTTIEAEADGKSVKAFCPVSAFGCKEDFETTALRACLGETGTGSRCTIGRGVHDVCAPLEIKRTNIGYIGGVDPDARYATVLKRAADIDRIMVADVPIADVTVSGLTFDGNRYGVPGLACLPGNSPYSDLDLGLAGARVDARWLAFVNAPGDAIHLGGTDSRISFSDFGQGTADEAAPRTGARTTSIFLLGDHAGAYFNAISYSGTAAINIYGQNQVAYGNLIRHNRYEISDGSGGGQLYLEGGTTNALVAGNVVDGEGWKTTGATVLASGCAPPPDPQFVSGIEAYGLGHQFFNNEVVNNSGSGMQLAGSNPTGRILISSRNPVDGADALGNPRYIERNDVGGLGLLGPKHNPEWRWAVDDLTFDDVLLKDNGSVYQFGGISLDSVTNLKFTCLACPGGGSASCMSGNRSEDVVDYEASSDPTRPATKASWNGGPCPTDATFAQRLVPAASHEPKWRW